MPPLRTLTRYEELFGFLMLSISFLFYLLYLMYIFISVCLL
jgi:hypothetical protein